jgi:glutamine---fructose-6-phosphate transaminase (isomerizing)
MYVGSDALALAPMTNRIAYLDEGDHAVLTRKASCASSTPTARPSTRETRIVPAENVYAEKGPFRHFMAKEIHEQPAVISDALARYYVYL